MENKRGDLVDLSPLGFGGKGDIVLLEGSVEKDKMMLITMRSYILHCTVYYVRGQKHRKCHTCCVADSVDLFPPWDLGEGGILRCLWRDQLKDLCPGGS